MGEPQLSSSVRLARKMLWHQNNGAPPRRVPVVILLGPAGAGKTSAINEIHRDLDWGVVHGRFDFQCDEQPTTVEVLIALVYDLSRKWRHRRRSRFTRFTLALIAIQSTLSGVNRRQDREELRTQLNELRRRRRTGGLQSVLNPLVSALQTAGIVPHPTAEVTKNLSGLLDSIWPSLVDAIRSLVDNDLLEALVDLNTRARNGDTSFVREKLIEDFLADVREDHRRMSVPESCDCDLPNRSRHQHKWVLLLDNVDHPGGFEFLVDIRQGRERAEDPLLIVATSGRWDREWESAWRPPWEPDSPTSDGLGVVPSSHVATFDYWERQSGKYGPPVYYPILLDPLQLSEVADVLGAAATPLEVALAHRATGGLPEAVRSVRTTRRESLVRPGVRDALSSAVSWQEQLVRLGLTDHVDDVSLDDFVTAAPFAMAPWLIPVSADERLGQPHVVTIIEELRAALWVMSRTTGEGAIGRATLHPWLAANLVSALTSRQDGGRLSYADQFTALLKDQDDVLRRAYCQLALGAIGPVVTLFEKEFDQRPHQEWIDRLDLVVHAPNELSRSRSGDELYDEFVNLDIGQAPQNRTPVRNNVTRLVVAGWLAADPLAMRSQKQNKEIASALRSLARIAQLPSITDLIDTATQAESGRWP